MTNERRGELKAPILDYFKDINFHTNNCMAYESLNSMLDSLIEALEERPSGKWIPLSERLPEEDGRFLVFLPDRNGTFMCADFLSGKWFPDDYECTSNHVIAWMPLPEPYRREGEAE